MDCMSRCGQCHAGAEVWTLEEGQQEALRQDSSASSSGEYFDPEPMHADQQGALCLAQILACRQKS